MQRLCGTMPELKIGIRGADEAADPESNAAVRTQLPNRAANRANVNGPPRAPEKLRSRAAVRLERRRNLIKEKIDSIRHCIAPEDNARTMSQAATLQQAAKYIIEHEAILQGFKQAVHEGMPARAVGDLLLMLNREGTIVLAVPTCVEHLQEDAEQLKGKKLIDYVCNEDKERVAAALITSLKTTNRFHCKLMLKDKSVYQYHVAAQSVPFHGNDCILVSAMKEFKCNPQEAGIVGEAMADSSYTAWCVCMPGGEVIYAGSSHRHGLLLGYKISEVCGKSMYTGIHPADINTVANMHKVTVNLGQSALLSYRTQIKDGGWATVNTLAVPCNIHQQGRPEYLVLEMRIKRVASARFGPGPLSSIVVQCCRPIIVESLDVLVGKCQGLCSSMKRDSTKDSIQAQDRAKNYGYIASLAENENTGQATIELLAEFGLIPLFGLDREPEEARMGVNTRKPAGLTSLVVTPRLLPPVHLLPCNYSDSNSSLNPNFMPASPHTMLSLQSMTLNDACLGRAMGPLSAGSSDRSSPDSGFLSRTPHFAQLKESPQTSTTAPLASPADSVFSQKSHLLAQMGHLPNAQTKLSPRRRYMLSQVSPRGNVGYQLARQRPWNLESQLLAQLSAPSRFGTIPGEQGSTQKRPGSSGSPLQFSHNHDGDAPFNNLALSNKTAGLSTDVSSSFDLVNKGVATAAPSNIPASSGLLSGVDLMLAPKPGRNCTTPPAAEACNNLRSTSTTQLLDKTWDILQSSWDDLGNAGLAMASDFASTPANRRSGSQDQISPAQWRSQ